MRILNTLGFLLIFMFATQVVSQTNSNTSCKGKKYSEFDFWVGNWDVYNTNGQLIGTNHLVKMQDNCVLQENWNSKTSSNRGTSYNFYNRTDGTWNQIWIDNTGFTLQLKGRFFEGKMVLKSSEINSKKGSYYNRITWFKNKDNTVTQIWEYVDKKNTIISEIFRGIYKKRAN